MIDAMSVSAERLLTALSRINERAERAQRQISSGLKLEKVSDQPDQVGNLLVDRAQLDQTQQIATNLGRAKAEVDTAERALENAVKMVETVVAAGVQGATGTVTVAQRTTIAVTVSGALEQLVAIAGTAVEGRFVFSGDNYDAIPYSVDLTQPNGVSAYAGGAATREVMHPSGSRFAVSRSADQIFDNAAPGASVFAAVNSLRIALENGPTVPVGDPDYQAQYSAQTAAIDAALGQVRTAQEHLGNQLSYYGTVQNRVQEAIDTASKLEVRQKEDLSAIQDADITEAALALTQATTQRDAALAARALIGNKSLFDYLG